MKLLLYYQIVTRLSSLLKIYLYPFIHNLNYLLIFISLFSFFFMDTTYLYEQFFFVSVSLQTNYSNLTGKVENFKDKINRIPGAEKIREDSDNDPVKVRETGDKLLGDIRTDREVLIREISDAKSKTNNPTEKAELNNLIGKVQESADSGTTTVKQGTNVAIDIIDDTDATAHLIYEFIPIFIVCEYSTITFIVNILLRTLTDNNFRFWIGNLYKIWKNN